MIEYCYSGKTSRPDLKTEDENGDMVSGIEYDIDQSSISSATLQYTRWDEDIESICVVFDQDLSTGDKTTLDNILGGY